MSVLKFCRNCNNVMYPKEDREQFLLLFACHNCKYQEVAEDSCVYKMEIEHSSRGRSQSHAAADPTLPRTRNVKCSNCKHQEAVFFQIGLSESCQIASYQCLGYNFWDWQQSIFPHPRRERKGWHCSSSAAIQVVGIGGEIDEVHS